MSKRADESSRKHINGWADWTFSCSMRACSRRRPTSPRSPRNRVRRTFEVNVYAPLFMAQAAVPLLPPGASVIITASAEYYTPNELLLDYAGVEVGRDGFRRGVVEVSARQGRPREQRVSGADMDAARSFGRQSRRGHSPARRGYAARTRRHNPPRWPASTCSSHRPRQAISRARYTASRAG